MRAMGAREVLHGLAILGPNNPTVGVWSRMAGDALDTGLLVSALRGSRTQKGRVAGALAAVLPIGVLDVWTAQRLRQRD